MSLVDIQKAFGAAIYSDAADALARLTQGPKEASTLESIGIYQNNTRERLRSVLVQTFPVCMQLVGEQCFEQMTLAHVMVHPCRTHDLEQYGADFPDTVARILKEQAALNGAVPYLTDMAKVEWTAHRSYFAPNRSSFDFAAFAELDEQQYLNVRFELAADLSTAIAGWPVAKIWQMHQPGNEVVGLNAFPTEQFLLIERPRYQAQISEIDKQTYEILNLIHKGFTLGELVEREADAQEVLRQALQQGWISGFSVVAA